MAEDLDTSGAVAQTLAGTGYSPSTPLRATLAHAVTANTELEAELRAAGRRTGVPLGIARLAPDEVRHQARMAAIDPDGMVNDLPLTAAWLLEHDNAAIAHDDTGPLSAIERKARAFGAGAVEGAGLMLRGVGAGLEIAQRNATLAAASLLPTPAHGAMSPQARAGLAGDLMGTDFKRAGQVATTFARKTVAPAGPQSFADQVAGGLGQIVTQIPATLLLGPGTLYAQGLGAMDEKVQDDKAPQWKKDLAVLGGGAVTGITEKWALDKMLGPVAGPAKSTLVQALARIGVASASEGGQETAENLAQDLLRKGLTAPSSAIGFSEAMEAGGVGAAVGGIVRSVVEAALHVRSRGAKQEAQAAQAGAHAQALDQLAALAEASKLRERSPEDFHAFAQQLTEDNIPHLFVDPRALAAAGVDLRALAQAMPSVAAQVQEAEATGGDIVIPTAEFMTGGPGQEFLQPLIEHARTAEDAMSPAEAKVYMQEHGDQMQAEIAKVMETKQGDEAFNAERGQVHADFTRQLGEAKRFTPDVNKQYATLLADYYATTASRLGLSPTELAQRYPLRVAAQGGVGANMLDQADPPKTDTPAFKAWFGDSKAVDADGKPLVVYHGTRSEFSVFDYSKIGQQGRAEGAGFYFTNSQEVASRYGKPMEVYLSMSKPLAYDAKGFSKAMVRKIIQRVAELEAEADGASIGDGFLANFGDARTDGLPSVIRAAADLIAADETAVDQLSGIVGSGVNPRHVNQAARDVTGYDGIVANGFSNAGDSDNRIFVAFFPEQIKSATGNNGQFNPKNPSILNQFAGPVARTADKNALATAQQRLEAGENPEAVRQETGWFKGADGKWRFEISDADASMKIGRKGTALKWFADDLRRELDRPLRVADVLDHQALFSAYPSIADYGVTFVPAGPMGDFRGSFSGRQFMLADDMAANEALSTLLHEIQHGIQRIEGFATGGSPEGMAKYAIERGREIIEREYSGLPSYKKAKDDGKLDEWVMTAMQATGKGMSPAEAYRRLAGEVEARNTQTRASFTDEERRLMPAYTTADVKDSDVIVQFNGVEAASAPEPANAYSQQVRGQIAFSNDITASPSTITLFKDADLSTFIHESGHFFLEVQADLASRIEGRIAQGEAVTDGEREIVADMTALLSWFGVRETPERSAVSEWHAMTLEQKRQHHETFARGFEAYAFEGNAPSVALQGAFQRFRAWMLSVYKSLTELDVQLTDEVRGVMDRMLATEQQIREAEAASSMGALFETAEQAGMTADEFKGYHALAVDATQQAIENLQARGLRDMQWLSNARGRTLKAMQKRASSLRREVEREVRAEVMSQPVYRAWAFLTGKGSNPDEGPTQAQEDYRRDLADWEERRAAFVDEATAAERLRLWEVSPESKVQGATPLNKGQFISKNRRVIAANVEVEALAWERENEKPAKPAAEPPQQTGPLQEGNGKLDTANLRTRYGTKPDAIWRKLSGLRMTSEANGINPDVVAEVFGFTSGDELVRALVDAELPSVVIEGMTDQRMLERHGDLATPEGLQRATDMAVHTEARARSIATELSALDRANAVREKVPGQRNTTDLLARAAKDYAAGVIARLKVRDIRPGRYAAAEGRAAKAAEKAFRAGDTATAAAEKRNQLIQNQATRAAHAAREQVETALAYFKRVQRPGSLPAAHHEQIVSLLGKFDLSTQTDTSLDNAARFRTWAKAQLDAGNVPPNVDALLSAEQRRRYGLELQRRNDDGELVYLNEDDQALLLAGFIDEAPVRNWREASVEELLGLRDTIKQIEHIGRRTKKVLTDRKNREFDAVVAEIKARITDVAERRGRVSGDTRSPNDAAGQRRLSWRGFFFDHIKVANQVHIMDGGAGGPLWDHLVSTANDAANGEVIDVAAAHDAIAALLKPVKAQGNITDSPVHFPTIGRSLNRQARIVIALNLGNESNQQRLLGGEGWTLEQIKPVLDSLTTADWRFVQGMWDHFESYRPRVAAMERLINGAEPEWVDARALQVTTADGQTLQLRGGYAPVIYDPRASGKAASHADEKDAKALMQAARVASNVNKSFTKARVAEVNGRPLLLSLDAMIGGVQDTIHYLHWQPWIIDANRLTKALDSTIRHHYGATVVTTMRNWVGDNAAGMRPARNAAERAVTGLARNVSFAGLAFNVMSAAKQVTGYSQSIAVIGGKWMARGAARTLENPRRAYLDAVAKSSFMEKRATTRLRDLAEVNSVVQDQGVVRRAFDRWGYTMMLTMQSAVDVPTWWGGYEKAIDAGHDETKAVALADQAVIDAQGSGLQKDLASIERATGAIRLLTGFMSFMNTTMNVNYRVLMSDQGIAAKAVDLLLVNTVPVVVSMVIGAALTPGGSGDDEPEELAKKFAAEQAGFLLGQMLGVRELSQIGYAAMGMPQGDYGGSVGLRLASDSIKLAKQVGQGDMDAALRKAAVNVAGETLRLPSAQVNKIWTGAEALNDGETENLAALAFGVQRP